MGSSRQWDIIPNLTTVHQMAVSLVWEKSGKVAGRRNTHTGTGSINKWCSPLLLLTTMQCIDENVQLWLSTSTSQQSSNGREVKDLTHQFCVVCRCVDYLHVKFTDAVDCEMMWANSGYVNVKIRACMILSNRLWEGIDLLCNTSRCRTCITHTHTHTRTHARTSLTSFYAISWSDFNLQHSLQNNAQYKTKWLYHNQPELL